MYIIDNLRFVRKKNSLSQTKFADLLGITRAAMASYEEGRSEPSLELLSKIATKYSYSLDELVNNDLSKYHNGSLVKPNVTVLDPPMEIYKPARFEFNCILVDNIASAGSVSFSDIGTSKGTPTFIPNLPKRPTPYIMLAVSGRSMEPDFHDGDFVVCYELRDQSQVMADTVHIVTSSEGIYLKEVRYLNERSGDPNAGLLRLKSLNERYDNVYLDPKESNIKLYRVVTVLHMV